jgi:hypothetical protein
VEKSRLSNNYQCYESVIDKDIELNLIKGKEFNEEVVEKLYKTYPSVNEK